MDSIAETTKESKHWRKNWNQNKKGNLFLHFIHHIEIQEVRLARKWLWPCYGSF